MVVSWRTDEVSCDMISSFLNRSRFYLDARERSLSLSLSLFVVQRIFWPGVNPTVSFTDLEHFKQADYFELILTTFVASFIF
jgi:hypothetical protein